MSREKKVRMVKSSKKLYMNRVVFGAVVIIGQTEQRREVDEEQRQIGHPCGYALDDAVLADNRKQSKTNS